MRYQYSLEFIIVIVGLYALFWSCFLVCLLIFFMILFIWFVFCYLVRISIGYLRAIWLSFIFFISFLVMFRFYHLVMAMLYYIVFNIIILCTVGPYMFVNSHFRYFRNYQISPKMVMKLFLWYQTNPKTIDSWSTYPYLGHKRPRNVCF